MRDDDDVMVGYGEIEIKNIWLEKVKFEACWITFFSNRPVACTIKVWSLPEWSPLWDFRHHNKYQTRVEVADNEKHSSLLS
jgi:hypothetical protein